MIVTNSKWNPPLVSKFCSVFVSDEKSHNFLISADVAYVSFALSDDNLMGNDSVIECVANQGRIEAYASWNTQRPSFQNTRQGVVRCQINCVHNTSDHLSESIFFSESKHNQSSGVVVCERKNLLSSSA